MAQVLTQIKQEMRTLAFNRFEKYQTQTVKDFPDIRSVGETVWLGSFSWTWANGRKKLIQYGSAKYPFDVPQTPAELARDYLGIKYPEPLRANRFQVNEWKTNQRRAPLYAEPCILRDAVYIDLKSAYWSIVRLIGWDTDYSYKRFWARGFQCDDFPFPEDKLTRNILVSAGVTGSVPLWYNGQIIEARRGNRLKNLGLWSAVNDILHFIANRAVYGCDAVYVHTDGYIMPAVFAWEFTEFLESIGLPYSVRYKGDARIYGVGAYTMDGHTCAKHMQHTQEEYSNLVERDLEFMTEHLTHFAKYRDTP